MGSGLIRVIPRLYIYIYLTLVLLAPNDERLTLSKVDGHSPVFPLIVENLDLGPSRDLGVIVWGKVLKYFKEMEGAGRGG